MCTVSLPTSIVSLNTNKSSSFSSTGQESLQVNESVTCKPYAWMWRRIGCCRAGSDVLVLSPGREGGERERARERDAKGERVVR